MQVILLDPNLEPVPKQQSPKLSPTKLIVLGNLTIGCFMKKSPVHVAPINLFFTLKKYLFKSYFQIFLSIQ